MKKQIYDRKKKKRALFVRRSGLPLLYGILLLSSLYMVSCASLHYREVRELPQTESLLIRAAADEVIPGSVYDRNGICIARGDRPGHIDLEDMYAEAVSRLLGWSALKAGQNPAFVLSRTGELYGTGQDQFSLSGIFNIGEKVGGDVRLTIDAGLSADIYDLLEGYGYRDACVLVINYATGEIWAAVTANGFSDEDEERLAGEEINGSLTNNMVFNSAIMPGSSIKPFIYASALEADPSLYDYQLTCDEASHYFGAEGQILVNCSHGKLHGILKGMKEGLKVSCNAYVLHLMELVEGEVLYENMKKFGFDRVLSLPGQLTYADSSFYGRDGMEAGYTERVLAGIGAANAGVSPFSIARGYMAFFNGGISRAPVLIRSVSDYQGGVRTGTPVNEDLVMCSPETAEKILDCMHEVVQGGTGAVLKRDDGWDICAKTGTAEYQYREGTGENAVWTIAGVRQDPADFSNDKAWMVVTCVDRCQGAAREVAAPIAGDVLDLLLSGE